MPYPLTTCIILAGGRSARLGQDKRRLMLWGETGPTLLEWMLRLATPFCTETLVVLNDPQDWPDLPARLIPDAYPNSGPLGGLASGLAVATTDTALLIGCDMPFIQPALLQYMLEIPRTTDAIIPLRVAEHHRPRNPHAAEPLLAIYRTACLPAIRRTLERGERRMSAIFDQLHVRFIPPEEWLPHDPQGHSFVNLNTPQDLATINAILPRSC